MKNIVLALLFGLVVGLLSGFYVRGKFYEASQVEAMQEQREDDVRAVKEMQADESELQATIDAVDKRTAAIRESAHAYRVIYKKADNHAQTQVDCSLAPIGDDLVGLLNSARAGTLADPATGGNAAGEAPAESEVEYHRR